MPYGTVFYEFFTSPLFLPHLPYQGAIRLRNVTNKIPNQDVFLEYTSDPTGKAESFPQDLGLPHPTRNHITADISDLVSYPKRGRRTHFDFALNISVRHIHWIMKQIQYMPTLSVCPDYKKQSTMQNI